MPPAQRQPSPASLAQAGRRARAGAVLSKKVPRTSAFEHIAVHIKTLIFDGQLRSGDRVPQDEIAAELEVSRIPIREALIALERDGWVTVELHRGAFVLGFDEASVLDLYEVVGLVYALIVRRAAKTATPEQLTELLQAHKQLAACGDPESFLRANERVLSIFHRIGGSRRTATTLGSVSGIVPTNFFAEVPTAMQTQKRGLAKVVKLAASGDGDGAAEEILDLMRRQGAALLAVLDDRGLLS